MTKFAKYLPVTIMLSTVCALSSGASAKAKNPRKKAAATETAPAAAPAPATAPAPNEESEAAALQESVASRPFVDADRRQGFSVNYMYMNVTELSVTFTGNTTGRPINDAYGSGHTGLNGVNLGYKLVQTSKWGFDLGMNILKPMNTSEADSSLTVYQAEGNLNYSFNRHFLGYFGANLGYFTSDNADTRITPNIGLQAGLGYRSGGFQLSAGYNVLSVSRKFDSNELGTDGSVTANILLSGFAAQIGYLF